MRTSAPIQPQEAHIEAERTILGAILLANELAYEVAGALRVEDLGLDSHRLIYRAMLALSRLGKPIDTVTLMDELMRAKSVDAIGGAAYLTSLTDGLPRRRSVSQYVAIVRDAARRKESVRQATRFIQAVEDKSNETSDCLDMLQDWLLELQAGDQEEAKAEPIADFDEEVYQALDEQAKSERVLLGTPTGIQSLDLATTGVRAADYWIVAGWPGHGKTALMMQMARAAVEQDPDCRVGVFSLEMRRDQLLLRLWASLAGIEAWKLRNPKQLSTSEWERLNQARAVARKWPMFIDDRTGLTPEALVARAQIFIRRHGCNLLFLDYIQKVRGVGRDRREKVTEISNTLFHLAKSTGVPIVALSQLARPQNAEVGKEPTMFMLKESGDLEADADTILLIHRKFEKSSEYNDQIILGKQRSGATDHKISVRFNGSNLKFEEPENAQLEFSNTNQREGEG